jgi:hypothetical protein
MITPGIKGRRFKGTTSTCGCELGWPLVTNTPPPAVSPSAADANPRARLFASQGKRRRPSDLASLVFERAPEATCASLARPLRVAPEKGTNESVCPGTGGRRCDAEAQRATARAACLSCDDIDAAAEDTCANAMSRRNCSRHASPPSTRVRHHSPRWTRDAVP